MPGPRFRSVLFVALLACAAIASACAGSGVLKKEYEYEEELYLSLDGTATLNLNASVPALVALRGADLNVDPRARLDRTQVRRMYEMPGVEPVVTLSRRDGRRFVHVRVAVDDVRQLSRIAPFAWSTYRFQKTGDVVEYRQTVGEAAGKAVGDVGWSGDELVAFRMHIPSVIPFHNSPSGKVQRGNILEWEQPLAERLKGEPLDLQVHMEPDSILYTTLLLFASTIAAAAVAFALVIWWVMRHGRSQSANDLRPSAEG
jgi:hypothetical protein